MFADVIKDLMTTGSFLSQNWWWILLIIVVGIYVAIQFLKTVIFIMFKFIGRVVIFLITLPYRLFVMFPVLTVLLTVGIVLFILLR